MVVPDVRFRFAGSLQTLHQLVEFLNPRQRPLDDFLKGRTAGESAEGKTTIRSQTRGAKSICYDRRRMPDQKRALQRQSQHFREAARLAFKLVHVCQVGFKRGDKVIESIGFRHSAARNS